jgi:uncharacterized lipoprotein YddW (UPF0748 family)
MATTTWNRWTGVAALGVCLLALPVIRAAEPQLRGVWLHANCTKNRAEADRLIARMERANLNAAFVLVWYWGGQAAFQTPMCPMLEGVAPGFDPLGYLVTECHRRQIEVHAWFVNGSYGEAKPRYVLDRHPEWAVDTAEPCKFLWYDLGQPAVRKFQSDLMLGALQKYDLDGLHFDYIRYNGSTICYCKHCQTEFARRSGCGPIERSRGVALPAAATVAGNRVARPTTAKVLARFSDGEPAIAWNELDAGQVLLFNWHASQPLLPAAAETMRRALRQWNATADKIFVIDTAPNREHYGRQRTESAVAALEELGYRVAITPEERLGRLPAGAVVVLPEVYLIPDDVAQSLEQFVRRGGRLVVIDGPVRSMRNAAVQRVLGLRAAGQYLNRLEVISAVGQSDLVAAGGAAIDLEKLKLRAAKWAEYRKWGVSELVRDVYRRAKQLKPRTQVTAAVFTPLASAERVYQDWPGWIREGCIDYVLPMAYTPNTESLARQLTEWKTVDPRLERIVPGLGIFSSTTTDESYMPRDLGLIFTQYRLCVEQGARGTTFFALDGTSAHPTELFTEPLIEALRRGPFAERVPAYRPPAREVLK